MALGPMEIHHKEFNTVRMGGYNKEEVDAFLDQVADEMDRLLHRTQELVGMVESMRAKVTEYDGMQQTLQNALINAQRSADNIVQEARAQAEGMLDQAGAESASRMEEANRVKDSAIQEANTEKDRITANLSQLRSAANEYIMTVRGLLESTSRTVSEYESLLGTAETNTARAAQEAVSIEAPAAVEEATFVMPPSEEPSYEPPAAEAPIYEPQAPAAEAPLYEPPAPPLPEYPATPAAEAPLYEPPAPPVAEYPAAPIVEEPLYVPPAAPEPSYQEAVYATPPYQDLPVEEAQPAHTYQEPANTETYPVSEPEAPVLQETSIIESAGMIEPHAYVPDIKPMDEMPMEDSPIPAMELGPTEPQAFVPSMHLDEPEAPATRPLDDSPIQPLDDPSRLTLEDLAGTVTPPLAPSTPPVSPAEVEQEFPPQPKKEEKGEKHFFWE